MFLIPDDPIIASIERTGYPPWIDDTDEEDYEDEEDEDEFVEEYNGIKKYLSENG